MDLMYGKHRKYLLLSAMNLEIPILNHGYDMAKFLEDKKVSWVLLCVNEMEFGSGTSIKTGYDWVKYPPTWSKDPYAKDMTAGPSGVGGGNNCTVLCFGKQSQFFIRSG
jgi:hypothetical protein